MKKIKGSCLCKKISFEIKNECRYSVFCHCQMCQTSNAEFSSYTKVKKENLNFKSKKTLKWFKSSKSAKRGFCNKCGASIFFKFKNSDNISVAAGMFNGKTGLKTMRNIFVGTKSDFYKITDKLPKYKRFSN